MSKSQVPIIEPYEEEEYLIEDTLIEDDNSDEEDEIEEKSLRLRPRPARASLTHNAIKSELMKMNKQQNRQEFLDQENNEEKMSRAARKRKRRREKVLEERRASGRSEDLNDDLAHFKSISISRRRSSLFPINDISNNYKERSSCSKLKCLFWLFFISISVFGLFYMCPNLNDLALNLMNEEQNSDQKADENTNENQESVTQQEQLINNVNEEEILQKISELEDLNNEENIVDEVENIEDSYLGNMFSNFFSFQEEKGDENVNEQENLENNQQIEMPNDVIENSIIIDEVIDDDFESQQIIDNGMDNSFMNFEMRNYENVEENMYEENLKQNTNEENLNQFVNEENLNLKEENKVENQESLNQNLNEENLEQKSCIINGQNFDFLNTEQCKILQEKQNQYESDQNNLKNEQSYFF